MSAFLAPPRWSADAFERDVAAAVDSFRREREQEPAGHYPAYVDECLRTLEELIELTVDLSQLRERAVEVVTAPHLLEALRFVAVYRVDCDAAQWSGRAALRALGGDAGSGADAGARATQDGPRRRRKALLRACTRWLLGAHLGLRGDEVVLGRGLNGRPRLERPPCGRPDLDPRIGRPRSMKRRFPSPSRRPRWSRCS